MGPAHGEISSPTPWRPRNMAAQGQDAMRLPCDHRNKMRGNSDQSTDITPQLQRRESPASAAAAFSDEPPGVSVVQRLWVVP